ncbi:MAG: 50S ribosomal protein L25 [Chloroflexi bacterium]|nr:50S ribosomal protein L25 [Chloroflexota bacterium]
MATQRLELASRPRSVTGKKVRFLRRQGMTPANIYGHGMASVAVEVASLPLQRLLRGVGRATLVTLHLEGTREPYTVMVRDVQRHPVTGDMLHADFYQVRMTERLRAEIPVHVSGTAPAVERGEGILVQNLRTIEVEALPADLPASVEVDVSGLDAVHDSVYARDVRLLQGVTLLTDPEEPIVSVALSRAEEEAAAEEAVAEPERITRERAEEERA